MVDNMVSVIVDAPPKGHQRRSSSVGRKDKRRGRRERSGDKHLSPKRKRRISRGRSPRPQNFKSKRVYRDPSRGRSPRDMVRKRREICRYFGHQNCCRKGQNWDFEHVRNSRRMKKRKFAVQRERHASRNLAEFAVMNVLKGVGNDLGAAAKFAAELNRYGNR